MFCPNCGKEVSEHSKFCPACGKKINMAVLQDEAKVNSKTKKPLEGKKKVPGVVLAIMWIIVIVWFVREGYEGSKKSEEWLGVSSSESSVVNTEMNSSEERVTANSTETESATQIISATAATESSEKNNEIYYMPVTSNYLIKVLEENALRASYSFKGERIELTGYINSFDSSGKYISISTGKAFSLASITCNLNSEEIRRQATYYNQGEMVTLCGKVKDVGEYLGYQIDVESFGPASVLNSESRPDWCFGSYSDSDTGGQLISLIFNQSGDICFEVYLYGGAPFLTGCQGNREGNHVSFTSTNGIKGILSNYNDDLIELWITQIAVNSPVPTEFGNLFYLNKDTASQAYYDNKEALYSDDSGNDGDRRLNNGISNIYSNNSYLLQDSSVRRLTEEDLYGFTAWECKVARNEIYARHGRKFNDKELQAYFDSCDWYVGSIEPNNFQESYLSDIEKANVDLIVKYEAERGFGK